MAKLSRKRGITSQILHIFIQDSSATTGAGLTGLLFNSASLACKYINAGGTLSGAITLEDITTLGTYQAPTANTNMRFKEVSSVSPSQGIYELHLHNDWMNLTGGSLVIMLAGATNMAQFRLEIDLQADVNVTHVAGTVQTAGDLAAMITTVDDFVDTEVTAIKTKTDFLPSATAGAAGGLFIAGVNAATSVTTALTANITGNLSGSVGSVTTGVILAATATSAQLVDDILDEVISEAAHTTANSLGLLIRKIAYILGHSKMNITDATGAIAVRNAADSANLWTGTVTDDATTTVRTALA